jgi:hypothetical protein
VQVEKAHVLLVGVDVENGHGGKAFAVAGRFVRLVDAAQVANDGHFLFHRLAAQAIAHLHAVPAFAQFRRQALAHDQMQVGAAGVERAHVAAIGLRQFRQHALAVA